MKISILFVLLALTGCSENKLDEAWLSTLNSMTFFDTSNRQLVVEVNGDVKVPNSTGGYYMFIFDEAKSETEAYYRENNNSGYTGLKIQNKGLHQVGTKADTTSGASLSTKKDFVSFSKIVKTLGLTK